MANPSKVKVILGSQWGDEGKGKLVDILAENCDIVARATGGANAGHTIKIGDEKFIFHLVPSGMLNERPVCVIGNGVVIHLETFFDEVKVLAEHGVKTDGRLLISDRAHLVFDYHKVIDELQEELKGKKKVGTTKRGIGPAYIDKIGRNGVRVHDLINFEVFEEKYRENLARLKKMYGEFEYDESAELERHRELAEKLKPMVVDCAEYLGNAIAEGKETLMEGANGALLDVDHGTYPYATSSNASIGGILTGTGIPAQAIGEVIGIMKAYTTRVGAGPFPTELTDDLGDQIRENGGEFGSTTGRPRRCGWYDAVVARYSNLINGYTSINLTKLDVLTGLDTIKIATTYKLNGTPLSSFPSALDQLEQVQVEYIELPGWQEDISKIRNYDDLPENAKAYIKAIEHHSNCKVSSIGVGPERDSMIFIQ